MPGDPENAPAGARPGSRRRGGTELLDVALSAAGLQARAVFRVVAAVAVGVVLLARFDENPHAAATVVPLLAGVYVLVTTVLAWPHGDGVRPWARSREADVVRALLDIAALCAVAASINEPRVTVLLLLCAVLLGYGLTLPASTVATLTAVAVTGCLVVWGTTGPLGTAALDEGVLLLLAFALAWCGLVACLIAVERERRARRITKLSASVRDMLRQALRAEASERARVADLLHDDVLQLLLATRHDISDAIDGDLELLPEARSGLEAATRRLRATVNALRDEGAEDETLGTALRGLADDPTGPRDATVDVEVDGALANERHPVLVAAARDVVRDAEATSAPTTVVLRAAVQHGDVVLVVQHDDRRRALGLDAEESHLIADVATRTAALDGTFDVRHSPAGVRTVTIRLPLHREAREVGDEPLAAAAETVFPTPKAG